MMYFTAPDSSSCSHSIEIPNSSIILLVIITYEPRPLLPVTFKMTLLNTLLAYTGAIISSALKNCVLISEGTSITTSSSFSAGVKERSSLMSLSYSLSIVASPYKESARVAPMIFAGKCSLSLKYVICACNEVKISNKGFIGRFAI